MYGLLKNKLKILQTGDIMQQKNNKYEKKSEKDHANFISKNVFLTRRWMLINILFELAILNNFSPILIPAQYNINVWETQDYT